MSTFKLTTFDGTYSQRLSSGGTTLGGSSGSNSGTTGGDVIGSPPVLSVVGLRNTVSLASNMGDNTLGSVLTTIQSSPWIAQFALPSNSATAYGSNSTHVAEISSAGSSGSNARADHYHAGIAQISASSSNTLQRGTVNLRAGTNISFGLTDTDGDGEIDTLTVNAAASSGGSSGGGAELGYTETSSNAAISATSAATAGTIVTAPAISFDGSTTAVVEIFIPRLACGTGVGSGVFIELYDGSTDLGLIWWLQSANPITTGVHAARRLTPSNASHTYSARAWRQVVNGAWGGNSGADLPTFIRVTRA